MAKRLGLLLQEWRRRRGLSLGVLATAARLSKSTISGWERGLHEPRLPELDAALTVLEVPLAERAAALALIGAPRAHRSLGVASTTVSDGLTPDAQSECGHLLRALRLRRGLTQEAVAEVLGVKKSAVSRWESSARVPSAKRRAQLLEFLGARTEERAALTARRPLLPAAASPLLMDTVWPAHRRTNR